MSRVITKVSFKDAGEKGVNIVYNNYDENGLKDETDKKSKHIPHKDFDTALQNLKTHVLLICDVFDADKMKKYAPVGENDVVAQNYRICGFTVSGEGEKEGVIITAYHTLKSGLGYVFNTPLTKFDIEGDSKYKFIKELEDDIEEVRKHANEYMAGKYGVMQGSLFEKPEPSAAASE